MLMNRAARQVLIQTVPEHVWANDWWIYLVVSALGTASFDPESRVLYRQRRSKVVRIRLSALRRLRYKLRRFLRIGSSQLVLRQAEEFLRLCGPALSSDYRSILDGLVETGRRPFWSRLAYACAGKVYRQSAFDQLVLKALTSLRRL